jgi:hypothetical protein
MILTAEEVANLLDYTSVDEVPPKVMSMLVPAVGQFLCDATGKDWAKLTDTYTQIDPTAKMAAGMLLVRWFENPGQAGTGNTSFSYGHDAGFSVLIGQLAAKAALERQTATS